MRDEELRSRLNEQAGTTLIYFDNHDYDASIIGVTNSNRVVYDYDLMIEEIAEDEDWEIDDALEWVDYNTVRGLDYFSEPLKPIIVMIDYDDDTYHAENENDEEDWKAGLKITINHEEDY